VTFSVLVRRVGVSEMGFNSVLKVAADFLRGGCCRGAGLRDRRGLPRGLFLGSGGKTLNGMVGESVTRKVRATQGCDPRRIRVQTPRPELKNTRGEAWVLFCG
jgi:hypothetical protein